MLAPNDISAAALFRPRTRIEPDGTVEGYASLFGEVDQARDMVMSGAFAQTLKLRGPRRIPMLFQHDPAEPIGVWLELREDQRGLFARGRLIPEVARGRELIALVEAGAIDGLSIGFRTVKGRIDPKSRIRKLDQVDLWEISIVTFPLLAGARVRAVKEAGRSAPPVSFARARADREWKSASGAAATGASTSVATRMPSVQRLVKVRAKRQGLSAPSRPLLPAPSQLSLSTHRRKYSPDQPRVAAGNTDGGQWTIDGGGIGRQQRIRLAAERPRLGPGAMAIIAHELAKRVIEAYRSENGLWDLFRRKGGAVTVTDINGTNVFGSNSNSPTYRPVDQAAADDLRSSLINKYPGVLNADELGRMPNNALYHAETTVLLRAARENGGTLIGKTLEVFGDTAMCNNCQRILPYVGLELGDPIVTFVGPKGERNTIHNGQWSK